MNLSLITGNEPPLKTPDELEAENYAYAAQQRADGFAIPKLCDLLPPKRYFVAQDQSCHWFMVPEEKRAEWQAWASIDEDDERAWTAPDYARAFDGPHTLTFTDPRFQ